MRDKAFIQKYYLANLSETKEKIRQSVNEDNLILQCMSNIDDLDRAANLLSKRLRDWYELTNPELSRKIADHERLADVIASGKDEKQKGTMGADLAKKDSAQIRKLASEILSLYSLRKSHEQYLEETMKKYCPNLNTVAGSTVGARLLSHAGSLKRLATMTSSTVQLLGAEKALFRHMKTGARPPKHGLILQHRLLSQAKARDRGKVARLLADKISMAARVDFFKGKYIADKLLDEITRKLR